MRRKNRDKEILDRKGRELLAAARLSEAEIERAATAPALFAAVQARVEAEKTRRGARRPRPALFWRWRPAVAAAFAVLIALTVGVAAFLNLERPNDGFAAKLKYGELEQIVYVNTPPESLPPVDEPPGDDRRPVDATLRRSFAPKRPAPERIAFRPSAAKKQNPSPPRRPPTKIKQDPDGVFYALPYTGHTENDELRIVRAELSPKSLFALGVDVAVENEAAKIKTDLLVGTDGVARAIRFVK